MRFISEVMKMFDKKDLSMEEFIILSLRKHKWEVDDTLRYLCASYPFFHKGKLQQAMKELVRKKLNNEKITGKWIKIDKQLKLESNIMKTVNNEPGNYWKEGAPEPGAGGAGNARDNVVYPQRDNQNNYEQPEDMKKIRIYDEFLKLRDKIKEKLPGISEQELRKTTLEEIKNLGFTKDEIIELERNMI